MTESKIIKLSKLSCPPLCIADFNIKKKNQQELFLFCLTAKVLKDLCVLFFFQAQCYTC